MYPEPAQQKINWYRSPLERETLAALNQRSDWKGLLQTLGHLGLLVLTAAAAWVAAFRLPLPVFFLLLFIHGTFYAFLLNGFHELCHKSVFKSKTLNSIFLNIISFLSWNNPIFFWTSHQRHHRFTLHPPDDLEVVLPVRLTLEGFLKIGRGQSVGLLLHDQGCRPPQPRQAGGGMGKYPLPRTGSGTAPQPV